MKRRSTKVDIGLILLVSLILSLPQLLGKGMIIGSDSIFHFNRFYDTAMQMAEGNFQYFISMYGFQGSGRIVNTLYGPMVAYLHGLLVLMAGSWYHYQMIANFTLFLLAGCSMYFFLKKGTMVSQLRLPVSIIYMTTYSIQYWTIRQGFTSWGAALLPICLIPFIDMIMEKKIHAVQLGICTALMVQTHLFSSFLLVLIYIPAFIFAFYQTNNRKKILLDLCLSIILFFFLTANVWLGLFEVYSENDVLAPFVNQTMSLNTINSNSYYWLINPVTLVFILLFELFHGCRKGKRYTALQKITIGQGTLFLFLSTSIVPWSYLISRGNGFAELIQFPFRFFIPCTVLFLFSFCMTLQERYLNQAKNPRYLNFVAIASVLQVLGLMSFSMYQWHQSDDFLQPGAHTVVHTRNDEELKTSFFDQDLSKSLKLAEKATPDYLPIYFKEDENKYELYKKEIIDKNPYFTKDVKDGKLIVSWEGQNTEVTSVPVVKYNGTRLVLNGQRVEDNQIELSSIGVVSLAQQEGENILEVSYTDKPYFKIVFSISVIAWGVCLLKHIRNKLDVLHTHNQGVE